MRPNDIHLEQSSKDSRLQLLDYLHIMQNAPNPSVPGEAKLAHLEHRPPSEGLKTRVSVPGECQERKYTHSTVRNGKEVAVLFPLRARNDVFSSFCVRNGTETGVLFPLRTRNNCFCAQSLRQWRSRSALEGHEKWVPCATR